MVFAPPKAIRGGIPLCFPQFSDFGPLGQHGFARNQEWAVAELAADAVTMTLKESDATLARGVLSLTGLVHGATHSTSTAVPLSPPCSIGYRSGDPTST